MAEPSRKPTFKQYGVQPVCGGCGRKLAATEALWFRGWPLPVAVFGRCCLEQASRAAANG